MIEENHKPLLEDRWLQELLWEEDAFLTNGHYLIALTFIKMLQNQVDKDKGKWSEKKRR